MSSGSAGRTASRFLCCTADPVPAPRPRSAVRSIRVASASPCSISAGRSAAGRSAASTPTRPRISSRTYVRLRTHLGIERWIVAGGSWGVALALAYAAREPARVAGLLLRGIYLARRNEDLWQYQEGASRLLPEAWDDYLAPIPPAERTDLIGAYHRRLTGEDAAVRLAAARAFLTWGVRTTRSCPIPKRWR